MGFFWKKKESKPSRKALDLRGASGEENAKRDSQISKSIQGVCTDTFPDNEHNTWNLLKILHIGERTYTLVEPEPNDVGYDRFVFVHRFNESDSSFVTLVTYCYDGEQWFLLSTTPDCDESFPNLLMWS